METEYKCTECKEQLSSREVNINDDCSIDVADYVCEPCFNYEK